MDILNMAGASDEVHNAWKCIQQEGPRLFWSPRNGGYWMIKSGRDIEKLRKDYKHFSMKGMRVHNNTRPSPAWPLDFEPLEHTHWRWLISPAFSPKIIAQVEETVSSVTIELIDGFEPRGKCEFVTEFTKVLPIVVL